LARGFAVNGFVKNLPDGRVQLVAEGTPEELQSFLAAIQAEIGYYIGGTQQTTTPATGRFKGFEIRF
jgi:acylphosphatase